MVYGVLKLINFGHAEVFMVGTMAVLGLVTLVNVQNPPPVAGFIGLLLICTAVALVASGGTALMLERVAYRPLRRRAPAACRRSSA
jgi:branched-chain amino acid transport system permease protein